MKLMTKELEKKFEKYPIGSQEYLGGDAKVIAKYFNPIGVGTWFITEGNKLGNGDYEMFGYCHLGDDDLAEFGYVRLSELENIKLPYDFKVERDLYLKENCTLIEALKYDGFSIPSYLTDSKDEVISEIVTNIDELNDEYSYTVARVFDLKHCVELHYTNGSSYLEYGEKKNDDYWENEKVKVDWFNKNMSENDILNKLSDLFKEYEENDFDLSYISEDNLGF